MGVVKHEYSTPKKARFFHYLELGYNQAAAAKEIGINKSTASRWVQRGTERRTRPQSKNKLGRPPIVSEEHVNQMVLWITGYYNRRVLSLETIAKEACGIKANYTTLLRAWAR
ncbi:hypothetical protein BP5796_11244 [Coleophoma crateriformis]|uniref:Uncharacterized protein n=1 Tax=Coleophoma crateriformis TaxID=565419 RepID=A0A3D8QHP3_9HELO|nr:hypothetical protein BP5796_11244 [Coleophoma crateriformis]